MISTSPLREQHRTEGRSPVSGWPGGWVSQCRLWQSTGGAFQEEGEQELWGKHTGCAGGQQVGGQGRQVCWQQMRWGKNVVQGEGVWPFSGEQWEPVQGISCGE